MLNIDNKEYHPINSLVSKKNTSFCTDVLRGLKQNLKQLPSKYFYDKKGDKIFQEIMNAQEYYPFNCELEIFSHQTQALAKSIMAQGDGFDLIELGAGDCTKSKYLLKYLTEIGADFTFMPIDISENIITYLESHLPSEIPGLQLIGLNGEYFKMLKKASRISNRRKVILFLGSNLGNMVSEEVDSFCLELRAKINKGDIVIVGMDLKKSPAVILAAYNDKEGITRRFNLNLLKRINKELQGNFDCAKFEHFPTYDPLSGDCKSYLVSLEKQSVQLKGENGYEQIEIDEGESIFMEVSHKFTRDEVLELGIKSGFETLGNYYDKKGWFLDTLWHAV